MADLKPPVKNPKATKEFYFGWSISELAALPGNDRLKNREAVKLGASALVERAIAYAAVPTTDK